MEFLTELEKQVVIAKLQRRRIDEMQNQLFNAFTLAHPELFEKDPPYDWDYLSSIVRAFQKYCDKLDAMGKHKLNLG